MIMVAMIMVESSVMKTRIIVGEGVMKTRIMNDDHDDDQDHG